MMFHQKKVGCQWTGSGEKDLNFAHIIVFSNVIPFYLQADIPIINICELWAQVCEKIVKLLGENQKLR